jgi:hypothetical protein
VSQSIDVGLRGLRQARERLENATKEWVVAYRLYVGTVEAKPQKRLQNPAGEGCVSSVTCLKFMAPAHYVAASEIGTTHP